MHPGGSISSKASAAAAGSRGAFREAVPVHRLAYSFGWRGRGGAPGSGLIEIDLIDQDGGTLDAHDP